MIDEIGIEHEVWLLDEKGKIVEPAIYSFPHDDYGFLIEIRTLPHMDPESVYSDWKKLYDSFKYQAKKFNLRIVIKNEMPTDYDLLHFLKLKYNYTNLPDLTENIHTGTVLTHATGIFGSRLTAGTHVHFSRKRYDGRRVQLPIREIVKKMDEHFSKYISNSNRIFGEYEIKSYGFEYRSLPAEVPLKHVIKYAFKILEES